MVIVLKQKYNRTLINCNYNKVFACIKQIIRFKVKLNKLLILKKNTRLKFLFEIF